jgi:hypothetical protein
MTDTTLAERLARCVKPLRLNMFTDDVPPDELAEYRAQHVATVLAALDMDALAQEVEAMVGAEREACARVADDEDEALPGWGEHRNAVVADQVKRDIAAAIRAREGGKP